MDIFWRLNVEKDKKIYILWRIKSHESWNEEFGVFFSPCKLFSADSTKGHDTARWMKHTYIVSDCKERGKKESRLSD